MACFIFGVGREGVEVNGIEIGRRVYVGKFLFIFYQLGRNFYSENSYVI
jgi:hypothetical protein